MTTEQFDELTTEQRTAMHNLQARSGIPWEKFLAQAYNDTLCNFVAIPNFHGMFVGIEPDGYTHS